MRGILKAGICLLIVNLLFPGTVLQAGTLKDAMEAYEEGNYEEALSGFNEAQVEFPDDPGITFNRSSAQYRTGNYQEAVQGFEQALNGTTDPDLREKVLYNLGNTAYRQGDLKAATDFYRKALGLEPSDLEAKQNLEFVLKKIEEQKQQKKEQDQEGEDKEGEEQNDSSSREKESASQKDKDASDRQEKQTEQEESQNSENQQDQKQAEAAQDQEEKKEELGKSDFQEAQPKEQEKGEHAQESASQTGEPMAISPEEAERLLNSLSDDQREFFKAQAKKMAPQNKGQDKDW